MKRKTKFRFFIGIIVFLTIAIFYKYSGQNGSEIGLDVLSAVKHLRGQQVDLNSLPNDNTTKVFNDQWTYLLQKHVSPSGNVNYEGFIQDSLLLDQFLNHLSENPPAINWCEEEQLAYWINAYNAFTIRLILDYYPLKSIKDISDGLPMINSPWDIKFFQIGGIDFDLNTIEHEILRKKYEEPRIHFAINCASISCPILRNEAYEAGNLEFQLEDQSISFLNDKNKNIIGANETRLSKIFQWFENDFTKGQSVTSFIKDYNPTLEPKNDIEYLDYNWNLNL